MNHITTYTGEDFNPLRPDVERIKIEDIAHALSMICRANGHFERFFSVAQHAINCTTEASARGYSKRVQLACLLHDASEAYICDIPRPVKAQLTEYHYIESGLQREIYRKFMDEVLSEAEQNAVNEIDNAMLVCEFDALMKKRVFDTVPVLQSCPSFDTKDFKAVERHFLSLFAELTGTAHMVFPDSNFLSVGIDGCKGKWLAVALSNHHFEMKLLSTIEDVCNCYTTADSIIVDMPIGLVESEHEQRPDALLRKQLKGKASSVFNTPCRQAVYESEYRVSSQKNFEITGKRFGAQSFAITPKIREVDTFLQNNPQYKNRLVESHPEYCFALLNNWTPIAESKKTAEGITKRIEILSTHYPPTRALVEHIGQNEPQLVKRMDDVLDALVLAVIGAIGIAHGFTSLPTIPPVDATGLKMQIVGAVIER